MTTYIRGTQFIKKNLVKNKFALVFNKIKEFSLNIQETEIPAVSVPSVNVDNPFNDIPLYGTKPEYQELNVSFVVDESLNSYGMIYDWMRSFAPVDSTFDDTEALRTEFDSYRRQLPDVYDYKKLGTAAPAGDPTDIATLIINNSGGIPELEVRFYGIFPIGLSPLPLNVTADSDDLVICTATFKYWYFTIHRKEEI